MIVEIIYTREDLTRALNPIPKWRVFRSACDLIVQVPQDFIPYVRHGIATRMSRGVEVKVSKLPWWACIIMPHQWIEVTRGL